MYKYKGRTLKIKYGKTIMAYFIIDKSHKILKKCGSHKKAVAANKEIPGEVMTERRYKKQYGKIDLPPKPTKEEKVKVKNEKKKETKEEITADKFAREKAKTRAYKKAREEIYAKIPEDKKPLSTSLTSKVDIQKLVEREGGKLYGIVQHPTGQYYGIYTKEND